MILIVGLGNPGEKYIGTKHNFGFSVVDHFLKDYSGTINIDWSSNEKLKSEICALDWKPKIGPLKKVILAKPRTYMNNSGMAVSLITSYYKIIPEDVWVVYDELDLPIGSMKIRFGGAAAGHHGVESIMDSLGTDKFWRFRMGIGFSHQHKDTLDGHEYAVTKHKITDVDDYVLGQFHGPDKGKVRELIKRGSKALQVALEKDIASAMNQYNSK